MRDREESVDAGDSELGPGVDLTISLLALVLLVLLVVNGQRAKLNSALLMEQQTAASTNSRNEGEIASLKREIDLANDNILRLKATISALETNPSTAQVALARSLEEATILRRERDTAKADRETMLVRLAKLQEDLNLKAQKVIELERRRDEPSQAELKSLKEQLTKIAAAL